MAYVFVFLCIFSFFFCLVTQNEKTLSQKYEQALRNASFDDEPEEDLAPFTFKDIASINLKTGHIKSAKYFQITKATKSPWDEDEDDDEKKRKKPRKRASRN